MRMLKMLALLAFILVAILVTRNGPGQRGSQYNAATVVQVEGVVQEVQQFWCPINGDEGTHLMLKTEGTVLQVHVAPRRFLRGNGVNFSEGDQVTVLGSMVTYQGHPAMIAQKVTRGDQTFAFREPNGNPLWIERWPRYAR